MKNAAALFVLLCLVITFASAENYLSDSFNDYGIDTIGIYTESYPDVRSDNFVFEVAAITANGILQDPRFFRYRYCNYDLVTPPLTSPEYPLHGNADFYEAEDLLDSRLADYLTDHGWENEFLDDFTEGTIDDLLLHAIDADLDAVLVVRYTPLTYILPFDGTNAGRIKKGRGLYPAVELYDAATGVRLWYSAYHTGHQIINQKQPYEHYVEAADEFFAHTDKDADTLAVETMISLTLDNEEAPFPEAAASTARTAPIENSTTVKRMFWTDLPSYSLYGNQFGIGYSIDFIGDYDLLYKDTYTETYPGDTPTDTAGTIENAVMHSFHIPLPSFATHNIAVEPTFSFGLMLPYTIEVDYTDISDDYHGGYDESYESDYATVYMISFGADLSVKYFLRLADDFSVFAGASAGLSWLQQSTSLTYNPNDSAGFINSFSGLWSDADSGLAATASILAGIKWETDMPVELYAELTPAGQGSGMMFSAGIRFVPFTYGFIAPHAANVSSGTMGY